MKIETLAELEDFKCGPGKVVFQINLEPHEIASRLATVFSKVNSRCFCAIRVETLGQVIFDKDTFCDMAGTNVLVDSHVCMSFAHGTLLQLLGARESDVLWSSVGAD